MELQDKSPDGPLNRSVKAVSHLSHAEKDLLETNERLLSIVETANDP